MRKNFKEFLNEASVGRVLQHTQGRNIGMITAHRGEYTASENKERNKQLESDIKGSGHGFIHVKGRYIENHGSPNSKAVDEHSYLVIGKKGDDSGHLHNTLTSLGKKYGQDSVLIKKHNSDNVEFHGTKEGGWPGLGKIESVGKFHPNRAGEFHSVLHNNKTFSFESVEIDGGSELSNLHIEFLNPVSYFNRVETEF